MVESVLQRIRNSKDVLHETVKPKRADLEEGSKELELWTIWIPPDSTMAQPSLPVVGEYPKKMENGNI